MARAKAKRALRSALALGIVALMAGACAQVAGIEERTFEAGQTSSPLCTEYCDTVYGPENDPGGGVCPQNYSSRAACLGVCELLPEGLEDDPTEVPNSIHCRLNAARNAKSNDEREEFCRAAGPGGDGQCGENCESYCMLVEQTCEGINALVPDCEEKCQAFGDSKRFSVAVAGEEFDHSGDTVQCRLVHVSSTAMSEADAAEHCPHSAFQASRWCTAELEGVTCERYCRILDVACKGDAAVYENDEQCFATCEALELGNWDDTTQDSVGCRSYHGTNALLMEGADVAHCPHAGPTGDGHCGHDVMANEEDDVEAEFASCRPYCRLLEAACSDAFAAEWESQAECVAECDKSPKSFRAAADSGYSVSGAEESGDTLACRTLFAVRALGDPENFGDYCPAAFGEAPCN